MFTKLESEYLHLCKLYLTQVPLVMNKKLKIDEFKQTCIIYIQTEAHLIYVCYSIARTNTYK